MLKGHILRERKYIKIKIAVNVEEIRKKLGMTQEQFSETFGIPLRTLENWEQGRRNTRPRSAALILLKLIEANPEGMAKKIAEIRRGTG